MNVTEDGRKPAGGRWPVPADDSGRRCLVAGRGVGPVGFAELLVARLAEPVATLLGAPPGDRLLASLGSAAPAATSTATPAATLTACRALRWRARRRTRLKVPCAGGSNSMSLLSHCSTGSRSSVMTTHLPPP